MAAFFTLLLGLSALLLGYFLYDFGKQNFLRETEAAIDSEMAHVISVVQGMSGTDITTYIDDKSYQQTLPIYLYLDADNQVLAGSLPSLPSDVERLKEGVIAFNAVLQGELVALAAKIHTFADGTRLLIARDSANTIESYEKLKWFSLFIMVFMLIVVLVSFFISVFVVQRINVIADTARHIMETGDLSRRILVDGNWDDLSHLSQTLNALLARVEALMEGIRDVSDSIAHDLRTPLTRLRTHIEEAKEGDASAVDMDRLLIETDQMLNTFNALLRISNIEKGKRHQSFARVDLQAILCDVIELYEPLADEKHIQFEQIIDKVPALSADRDLLFQLCANLLDNAVKFSPEKSTVSISLSKAGNYIRMVIADQGPGIAPDEYDKVFDRFYRADKSRHTSGNGLGLSLVKAIVEQHAGDITLSDNQPGLRIVITL